MLNGLRQKFIEIRENCFDKSLSKTNDAAITLKTALQNLLKNVKLKQNV